MISAVNVDVCAVFCTIMTSPSFRLSLRIALLSTSKRMLACLEFVAPFRSAVKQRRATFRCQIHDEPMFPNGVGMPPTPAAIERED